MYVHREKRLVYLATPRTASTSTAVALKKVGFEKLEPGDHHLPLYGLPGEDRDDLPVTLLNRSQWTVFTTIRNHWDVCASWAAMKPQARDLPPPWPREVFELALDPESNRWVKKHRLFDLHLPDCDVSLRYEHLWDDLCRVLTVAGVQMPHLGFHNVSDTKRGHHYSYFMTDEVAEWIGDRFRQEIDELGFSFERLEEHLPYDASRWAKYQQEQERLKEQRKVEANRVAPEPDRQAMKASVPSSPPPPEGAVLDATEVCALCDERAMRHPWVIVTSKAPGVFESLPVCNACHRYEEYRKRQVKGHFFPRSHASVAVSRAGSSSIGG